MTQTPPRARTYTAQRLDTALSRIKRDLGEDAVILSSRSAAGGVEVRALAAEEAPEVGEVAVSGASLLERLLIKNGLDEGLARLLSVGGPRDPKTLREATEALAATLGQHFPFATPELDGGRRVLALVGPTGVGKTTTLAKLAARAALIERRAVGLVSLDGYRIGAVAQIEQYADLIGVRLEVARDADSFGRALRRLADAEVIFVDTAGRAPRDRDALTRMAETLHGTEVDVDVMLCVAAQTRKFELDDIAQRHAVLLPKHLVVTKMDEALRHDGVLQAQLAAGLPLAFLSTGQRVPEDLEEATPERLAAALCGEEVYA
jgi:flagellar biosynthesis protein FlhF